MNLLESQAVSDKKRKTVVSAKHGVYIMLLVAFEQLTFGGVCTGTASFSLIGLEYSFLW